MTIRTLSTYLQKGSIMRNLISKIWRYKFYIILATMIAYFTVLGVVVAGSKAFDLYYQTAVSPWITESQSLTK